MFLLFAKATGITNFLSVKILIYSLKILPPQVSTSSSEKAVAIVVVRLVEPICSQSHNSIMSFCSELPIAHIRLTSWNSRVHTAIRLRTGRPGNRSSIRCRFADFLLLHSVQKGSGAHTTSKLKIPENTMAGA